MWVIWVIIALLVICAAATVAIYLFTFHSSRKGRTQDHDFPDSPLALPYKDEALRLISEFRDIPAEEVWIESFDGLKLRGRYYHVADGAPVAICCHGYRSTAVRDFCGGARMLMDRGMNALLIDERAQGQSDGCVMTFGINERLDVLEWAKYIKGRFGDVDYYLVGVSMGAATVLLAAELDFPPGLKGVMADCPYASPRDIIVTVAGYMHIPAWTLVFALIGARLFGHFELSDITAVDTVKKASVPVLIIHGLADDFVPEYMSRIVVEANPEMVTRVTVEGAGHAMSFLVDRDKYTAAVDAFLEKTGFSS